MSTGQGTVDFVQIETTWQHTLTVHSNMKRSQGVVSRSSGWTISQQTGFSRFKTILGLHIITIIKNWLLCYKLGFCCESFHSNLFSFIIIYIFWIMTVTYLLVYSFLISLLLHSGSQWGLVGRWWVYPSCFGLKAELHPEQVVSSSLSQVERQTATRTLPHTQQ